MPKRSIRQLRETGATDTLQSHGLPLEALASSPTLVGPDDRSDVPADAILSEQLDHWWIATPHLIVSASGHHPSGSAGRHFRRLSKTREVGAE